MSLSCDMKLISDMAHRLSVELDGLSRDDPIRFSLFSLCSSFILKVRSTSEKLSEFAFLSEFSAPDEVEVEVPLEVLRLSDELRDNSGYSSGNAYLNWELLPYSFSLDSSSHKEDKR